MAGLSSHDPITSADNRWLKRARKAALDHDEEILFEGPKHVEDALAKGLVPIAVLVREGAAVPPGSDPACTHIVADRAFRSLGETATPQGVIAIFKRPKTDVDDVISAPGCIVALDAVQDPGNVGAIIRLAAAFDLAGVIALTGCADPFSPRAIRGSAGAVLDVRIGSCSVEVLIERSARAARPMFVAMPSGSPIDGSFSDNAVVVLGSEGRGASPKIVRSATAFSIPTSNRVESLNVATAAAITVWEMTRGGRS